MLLLRKKKLLLLPWLSFLNNFKKYFRCLSSNISSKILINTSHRTLSSLKSSRIWEERGSDTNCFEHPFSSALHSKWTWRKGVWSPGLILPLVMAYLVEYQKHGVDFFKGKANCSWVPSCGLRQCQGLLQQQLLAPCCRSSFSAGETQQGQVKSHQREDTGW